MTRHSFQPYSWGARSIIKIWRMGTVAVGGGVGTRLLGDVNGDGRDDAVVMFRDSGTAMVALSSGSSFAGPLSWSYLHTVGASTYFLADVNGDAIDDLVAFWVSNGRWRELVIRLGVLALDSGLLRAGIPLLAGRPGLALDDRRMGTPFIAPR